MAQIELRSVSKWYGESQVLKDISLNVSEGERIVICGPSGSGKSTLLRCINGLEEHQQGQILVNGREVTGNTKTAEEVRRQVGMVFDHGNLFPHLTVLGNCTLAPVSVHKMRKEHARELALYYLERLKISERANHYPAQLSCGQQQRVAIARTLCMRPNILLFDEPSSALGLETVEEVLETMVLLADQGMTMLCVTHETGIARQLAHRVAFLDAGRILEMNEPSEFFVSPRHERAKLFLRRTCQQAAQPRLAQGWGATLVSFVAEA